jgi:hypothetical protein
MTTLRESQSDEFADRARGDIMEWVRSDSQLVAACAAAVDPLEIAAWLETRGLSKQVAADSFGYPDVFSAAEVVYATLPFAAVEPPAPPAEQMGGPMDLLRGALYVLPAFFLPVVVVGFSLRPHWWVLPIGLTVAWAVSQAAAVFAWALRARGSERSYSLVAFSSVMVSATVCAGCSVLACLALGGNQASVLEAVGVAVYIAAAGMLLFRSLEWLLGLCILPAALGCLFSTGHFPLTVSQRQGAWAVVASVVLVVVTAIGHVSREHWRRPSFAKADRGRAGKYLVYGLGCGLLVSIFIGFSDALSESGIAVLIAMWPLMLTLGLMEWQLRSFRARVADALPKSSDLAQFAHRARRSFLRSTGIFAVALVILSAMGVAIGYGRSASNVMLLVASIGSVGVALFLALMVVSSGQINLVLICWGTTFAVFAALLTVTAVVSGHVAPAAGLASLLAAAATAIVFLAVQAWRVLASPINY